MEPLSHAKEKHMAQHQHINKTQPRRTWLQGSLAGFIATGPMTLFMLVTQRYLPKRHRYALPPEIITEDLARRTHVRWHMNKTQILVATLVSHFASGGALGALYGPLQKKISLPPPVKASISGPVIWAATHLALLPLRRMAD